MNPSTSLFFLRPRAALGVVARRMIVVAVALCGLGTPRAARALEPFDVEVAALGGFGTAPFKFANPLGPMVGGRAGIVYRRVYVGLEFSRYFGADQDGSPILARSVLYGAQVGWGGEVSKGLELRVQFGFGRYGYTPTGGDVQPCSSIGMGAVCGDFPVPTIHSPYLEPGVVAMISLSPALFVAVDANLILLPGLTGPDPDEGEGSRVAGTFHAQIGAKF